MPTSWLERGAHPLLVQLVRHISAARVIAARLQDKRLSAPAWSRLHRELANQSKAIASLAKALRLAPSARYSARKTLSQALPRPWEFGG